MSYGSSGNRTTLSVTCAASVSRYDFEIEVGKLLKLLNSIDDVSSELFISVVLANTSAPNVECRYSSKVVLFILELSLPNIRETFSRGVLSTGSKIDGGSVDTV